MALEPASRLRDFGEAGVTVTDLGSTDGTTLDAEILATRQPSMVPAGARIVIGGRCLVTVGDDRDEVTGMVPALTERIGATVGSLAPVEAEVEMASRSSAERAFRRNEVVIVADVQCDPEFGGQTSVVANRIRSAIVAPLNIRGEVVGVRYLDHRVQPHCFSEKNIDFIRAFAAQASVALYNARLYNQAVTDGMTGLYNNKLFWQRLGEELRRATRHGKALPLVMFDIDHFKQFNDTYGTRSATR